MAGALVQVSPPAAAPITATVVTIAIMPVSPTDAAGDAHQFVVTYQITPPGGAWTVADNGTYTVALGGAHCNSDLAGNAVAAGTVGTFLVQLTSSKLAVTGQPPGSLIAGTSFSVVVSAETSLGALMTGFNGSVTIALLSDPTDGVLLGTLTVQASGGVATFSNLELDHAASGYTIKATGTGLAATTTNSFDITPAAASQLLVTAQPPSSVTAGSTFGLAVTAEDQYGHIANGFTGSVTIALKNNPGSGSLLGTLSENATSGVAAFGGLTLDMAGNGYTIRATGNGVSGRDHECV